MDRCARHSQYRSDHPACWRPALLIILVLFTEAKIHKLTSIPIKSQAGKLRILPPKLKPALGF